MRVILIFGLLSPLPFVCESEILNAMSRANFTSRDDKREFFSGEMNQLSKQKLDKLLEFVPEEKRSPELKSYLRAMFHKTVEREWKTQAIRKKTETTSERSPLLDKHSQKSKIRSNSSYANIYKAELELLLQLTRYCSGTETDLWALAADFRLAHDGTIYSIESEHEKLTEEPISLFFAESFEKFDGYDLEQLAQAVRLAIREVETGKVSGRQEEPFMMMVWGFMDIWREFRGKEPTRHYLAMPKSGAARDGGPFIEFCQLMSKCVNEALPPELQRKKPADCAMTFRRLLKEKK